MTWDHPRPECTEAIRTRASRGSAPASRLCPLQGKHAPGARLGAWKPKLQAWGCPGERHSGPRPLPGLPFRLSHAYLPGGGAEEVAPKLTFAPYRTSYRIASEQIRVLAHRRFVTRTGSGPESNHIYGLNIFSGNIFEILTDFSTPPGGPLVLLLFYKYWMTIHKL